MSAPQWIISVKKRTLGIGIARRLPYLARSTQAALETQGNGHPILGQIVTLIDQRCALTIRRLMANGADEPEK